MICPGNLAKVTPNSPWFWKVYPGIIKNHGIAHGINKKMYESKMSNRFLLENVFKNKILVLLLSDFGETEPFWDFPFLPLGDFEPF
jgi:hypothetical protein